MVRKVEQVGFSLNVSEAGEVVLVLGSTRLVLGPQDQACEELRRFLREVDHADGSSGGSPLEELS